MNNATNNPVEITVTARNLYNSYNPKRSQPWEYSLKETGLSSNKLGALLSIRRHANGTYTVTGTKATEYNAVKLRIND